MKKTWKRVLAFCTAALMAGGLFLSQPLQTEAAATAKKVEYDGYGEVDVDFVGRVQYRNVKVTVKDSNGKTYKAVITERDSDDLSFRILDYKKGLKYTFTISGIKKRGEASFGKVRGTVKIPSKSGWTTENGKKTYIRSNGKTATGITKIGRNYYFFDKSGKMITGWCRYDGDWYYMQSNGVMVRNRSLTIDGRVYYFDDDGECENR